MHELTKLIYEDMRPALGVTEPGAIAFAVSTARRHTAGEVKHERVIRFLDENVSFQSRRHRLKALPYLCFSE